MKHSYAALLLIFISFIYSMEEDALSQFKNRLVIAGLNQQIIHNGEAKPFIQWISAAKWHQEDPLVDCDLISAYKNADNSISFTSYGVIQHTPKYQKLIKKLVHESIFYIPKYSKEEVRGALLCGYADSSIIKLLLNNKDTVIKKYQKTDKDES